MDRRSYDKRNAFVRGGNSRRYDATFRMTEHTNPARINLRLRLKPRYGRLRLAGGASQQVLRLATALWARQGLLRAGLNHTTCDTRARVACGISFVIVRFLVNHQRRATLMEERV